MPGADGPVAEIALHGDIEKEVPLAGVVLFYRADKNAMESTTIDTGRKTRNAAKRNKLAGSVGIDPDSAILR